MKTAINLRHLRAFVAVAREGIDVACAEGVLRILSVHPTGGRAMAVKDFLNARRVVVGDAFVRPTLAGQPKGTKAGRR